MNKFVRPCEAEVFIREGCLMANLKAQGEHLGAGHLTLDGGVGGG